MAARIGATQRAARGGADGGDAARAADAQLAPLDAPARSWLARAEGVSLVTGFFNESLGLRDEWTRAAPVAAADAADGAGARALASRLALPPAVVIDIDVDLAISARQVLEFVFAARVARVGTLIGYDDWWSGWCSPGARHRRARRRSRRGSRARCSRTRVVAERYGVRFACVCGGCKRTRVDASNQAQYACDMHARTGAVFMVEAIGVAPVTDMLMGEAAVQWATESPRCRALAAGVG